MGLRKKQAARQEEGYQRRKAATDKAAKIEADKQAELRTKMETGNAKPPAKLTREEMATARRGDDGRGGPVKPKRGLGR